MAKQASLEMEEMFCSASRWPPHYFVAEEGSQILGFGGLKSAWLMSNTFELIWVNVSPEAMGKGVGAALTWHRLGEIMRRGGTLVLLMTRKTGFFEKFQFQTVCNFNGWALMVNQLRPVELAPDRTPDGN